MRLGVAWSDACILNISSRGLMIRASRPVPQGSMVELRRGDHVIIARVVWREGAKAGLQAEDCLPVEDILTLSQAAAIQVAAGPSYPIAERRRQPRSHDQSRLRARVMEFASIAFIAVSLAGGALLMVGDAFSRPLAEVRAALGP
jgi:hypothetical protein